MGIHRLPFCYILSLICFSVGSLTSIECQSILQLLLPKNLLEPTIIHCHSRDNSLKQKHWQSQLLVSEGGLMVFPTAGKMQRPGRHRVLTWHLLGITECWLPQMRWQSVPSCILLDSATYSCYNFCVTVSRDQIETQQRYFGIQNWKLASSRCVSYSVSRFSWYTCLQFTISLQT